MYRVKSQWGGAPVQNIKARARQPQKQKGEMNDTERAYASELDKQLLAGEIQWYGYEAITLILAKATTYTLDFFIVDRDGFFRAVEVKGRKSKKKRKLDKETGLETVEVKDGAYWPEDSRIKIKVAAKLFPFDFVAVSPKSKVNGGGWVEEVF